MAPPVVVRVGCALDTSVERSFGDLEKRAQKAGERVRKALRSVGGTTGTKLDRTVVDSEQKKTRVIEGEAAKRARVFAKEAAERRRQLNAEERELRASSRAHERAARAKEKAAREAARATRTQAREQERASREMQRIATRTSHRATRFFWPNAPLASVARRGMRDVLTGTGVEANVGGMLQRVTGAEKTAQQMAVLGYRAGEEGPAGKRVSAKQLADEARQVGENFGMTTEEVLAGQKAFADLLGNLQGARDVTAEMGKIARSQGTDFEATMRVAGKLDSMYSNIPEYQNDQIKKNKAISAQMRTLIYLGKTYSIPLEDMAEKVPIMTGVAGMYQGDVNKNFIEMMTLMQLAEKGPGRNVAEAATMSGNIAKTLAKRSDAAREFAGMELIDDSGKIKGIQDMLLEMFSKTEGGKVIKGRKVSQVELLNKIFPNIRQMGGIQESLTAFQQAGGGEAGREAVRRQFAPGQRAVSNEQIAEDLALVLDTTEAKAAKFNQQLERIVATAAEKLIPSLEKLAPTALKAADALGSLVQWMSEHPGQAIAAAISVSIARAGLESVFRAGVERAILGGIVTPGGGRVDTRGRPVAGGGGMMGGASAALMITATAVTLHAAGRVIIDQATESYGEAQKRSIGEDVQTYAARQNLERQARQQGGLTEAQATSAERLKTQQEKRIEEASGAMKFGVFSPGALIGTVGRLGRGLVGAEGGTSIQQEMKRGIDAQKLDDLRTELSAIQSVLRSGIRITNPEEIRQPAPAPGVPGEGRDVS